MPYKYTVHGVYMYIHVYLSHVKLACTPYKVEGKCIVPVHVHVPVPVHVHVSFLELKGPCTVRVQMHIIVT